MKNAWLTFRVAFLPGTREWYSGKHERATAYKDELQAQLDMRPGGNDNLQAQRDEQVELVNAQRKVIKNAGNLRGLWQAGYRTFVAYFALKPIINQIASDIHEWAWG